MTVSRSLDPGKVTSRGPKSGQCSSECFNMSRKVNKSNVWMKKMRIIRLLQFQPSSRWDIKLNPSLVFIRQASTLWWTATLRLAERPKLLFMCSTVLAEWHWGWLSHNPEGFPQGNGGSTKCTCSRELPFTAQWSLALRAAFSCVFWLRQEKAVGETFFQWLLCHLFQAAKPEFRLSSSSQRLVSPVDASRYKLFCSLI